METTRLNGHWRVQRCKLREHRYRHSCIYIIYWCGRCGWTSDSKDRCRCATVEVINLCHNVLRTTSKPAFKVYGYDEALQRRNKKFNYSLLGRNITPVVCHILHWTSEFDPSILLPYPLSLRLHSRVESNRTAAFWPAKREFHSSVLVQYKRKPKSKSKSKSKSRPRPSPSPKQQYLQ